VFEGNRNKPKNKTETSGGVLLNDNVMCFRGTHFCPISCFTNAVCKAGTYVEQKCVQVLRGSAVSRFLL
jgi:hypothetical protein